MNTKENQGIDYGMGLSNVDMEKNIRYGVVSMHTIGDFWYNYGEPIYGELLCGECTVPLEDSFEHENEKAEKDFFCPICEESFWSDEAYPEEPAGWEFIESEYKMVDCLDTDVMILKSPFFCFAHFCSPCVPGAGNINSPLERKENESKQEYLARATELGFQKVYCPAPDMFESAVDFPIFRVE